MSLDSTDLLLVQDTVTTTLHKVTFANLSLDVKGAINYDEKYIQKTGDNMTGDLTLGTDKITLDGGTGAATFAGQVTLPGSGTGRQAATFIQVSAAQTAATSVANAAQNTADTALTNANAAQNTADSALTIANAAIPLTGGALTGNLTSTGDITTTGSIDARNMDCGTY